jgi:hypothetical protein
MKDKESRSLQLMVGVLALALTGAPDVALAASGQDVSPAPQTQESRPSTAPAASPDQTTVTPPSSDNVPDSPGATRAQAQEQGSGQPAQPPESPQKSQPSAQQPQQKPSGTAAAEPVNPSGVAASEPAGAAIAPAKQRRMRSLLIKVGAVVAAGAAVGTVAALSLGTSSKPPGSH